MISNRTKMNIFQLLSDLDPPFTISLLSKFVEDTSAIGIFYEANKYYQKELLDLIKSLDLKTVTYLTQEIAAINRTLRSLTNPEYKFDERWAVFLKGLHLDGYDISDNGLIAIDPNIESLYSSEDSLKAIILGAKINDALEIARLIDNSAEDFIEQPPDYNGCLANLRTSLETLGKSIASRISRDNSENKDLTKWGNCISYLRSKSFISKKEEECITSVYSLLSEHHRPIYLTEEESVRFARALGLNMSFLLVKKYVEYSN